MTDKLVECSKVASRDAIMQYAKITNDFNPIHVDPEFAAKTPMGGIIAHGMLSLNLIWQSIRATFGDSAAERATLDIRFSKPVKVDDSVTAGGQKSAEPGAGERYDVWIKNQRNETVIKGHLSLRPK